MPVFLLSLICRAGAKKHCLGFSGKLGEAEEYISPFYSALPEDLNLSVFSLLNYYEKVLLLSNSFFSCKVSILFLLEESIVLLITLPVGRRAWSGSCKL